MVSQDGLGRGEWLGSVGLVEVTQQAVRLLGRLEVGGLGHLVHHDGGQHGGRVTIHTVHLGAVLLVSVQVAVGVGVVLAGVYPAVMRPSPSKQSTGRGPRQTSVAHESCPFSLSDELIKTGLGFLMLPAP